jgi:3'-phosphoadenosine 5'-phosphosulfate sulfotransferase (PAPS reductase)/FAD synthetase
MPEPRIISWFSCGAASALATKLTPKSIPVYCDTGAEHPDNKRFLRDCEKWFGRKVVKLRSDQYVDTWDVWTKERYLSGIHGAPCTRTLKIGPRLEYQRPTDIHVFGYTYDGADRKRARAFRTNYPELTVQTPLIQRYVTKAECLAIVKRAGIQLPILYGLGFQNNNCMPCVKASAPGYWALVRKEFPDKFQRMVKLSRELDVRLTIIKGERCFIDEIPLDYPTTNPIVPSCDFLCSAVELSLDKV